MDRIRLASSSLCNSILVFAITFAFLLPLACSNKPSAQQVQQQPPTGEFAPQPTGPPLASAPEDGQWVMPSKDYANTRYSGLDEINTDNVKNLKVAWTFSTGLVNGHEAAPIVVGNTMYVVTPFPNYLYALDLGQPGAPMKWRYDPKPVASAQGVACCDLVNRGCAYSNGKIYYNVLDNHTVCIDAETGREVWKTKLGDINLGETMTMAPLVVKEKVLVGNSGGEF